MSGEDIQAKELAKEYTGVLSDNQNLIYLHPRVTCYNRSTRRMHPLTLKSTQHHIVHIVRGSHAT